VREFLKHNADVVIDSHATMLRPLITWCRGVSFAYSSQNEDVTSTFEFHTDSEEYFQNLGAILNHYGWLITDMYVPPAFNLSSHPDAANVPAPRAHAKIVYFSSSDKTVNAVYALVHRSKDTDLMIDCCVIVDRYDSCNELRALRNQRGKKFEVICSSEILDDLLRQVRVWARLGYEFHEIQEALDTRFGEVEQARATAFSKLYAE
jgi:hypothetical protein